MISSTRLSPGRTNGIPDNAVRVIESGFLFILGSDTFTISRFKTDKYYALNSSSFKKAQFKELIEPFCEKIKEAYHLSKQFYVTRKINYSKFITIIRQICKKNHIPFNSQIKYDKSSYDICYYIYYNDE